MVMSVTHNMATVSSLENVNVILATRAPAAGSVYRYQDVFTVTAPKVSLVTVTKAGLACFVTTQSAQMDVVTMECVQDLTSVNVSLGTRVMAVVSVLHPRDVYMAIVPSL